jgi:hypothetical protein
VPMLAEPVALDPDAVPMDFADAVAVPVPDALVLVPVLLALLAGVVALGAMSMVEEVLWAVARAAMRAKRMDVSFIVVIAIGTFNGRLGVVSFWGIRLDNFASL